MDFYNDFNKGLLLNDVTTIDETKLNDEFITKLIIFITSNYVKIEKKGKEPIYRDNITKFIISTHGKEFAESQRFINFYPPSIKISDTDFEIFEKLQAERDAFIEFLPQHYFKHERNGHLFFATEFIELLNKTF